MSDFVILLGVLLLYMCATIAVGCYLWYEHNALIRRVQKLQEQLDTVDHFVDQMLDYQVRDGCRLNALEELTGVGHSETQSDDVSVGGR